MLSLGLGVHLESLRTMKQKIEEGESVKAENLVEPLLEGLDEIDNRLERVETYVKQLLNARDNA